MINNTQPPSNIWKVNQSVFVLLLILGLVTLLFSPIYQLTVWGDLFYQNGEDEYAYLNYAFAKKTFGLTRLSSGLVILLHDLGLSGAEINLILDLTALTLVSLFFSICTASRMGVCDSDRRWLALITLIVFPIILTTSNPIHAKIVNYIQLNDFLSYFVVVNHSAFPAILRTPESQLSIAVLAMISYLIISTRHGWIALVLVPATYFFSGVFYVLVFMVYIILSNVMLRYFWQRWICIFILFVAISFLVRLAALYFSNYSDFIESHTPVLGLNFCYMVFAYAMMRFLFSWQSLSIPCRNFVHALVIGSFLVTNLNIFGGLLIQPQHFEIDGGIATALLVIIFILFATPKSQFLRKTFVLFWASLLALSVSLLIRTSYRAAKTDAEMLYSFNNQVGGEFLGSQNIENVFLSDIFFSSKYNGLYMNKGGFFLSSLQPIFLQDLSYYERLTALRRDLSRRGSLDLGDFRAAADELDYLYRSEFRNWNRFEVTRRGGEVLDTPVATVNLSNSNYKFHLVKTQR